MEGKYRRIKREFFINLRSTDAEVQQTAAGNNLKFSWNIKNIEVSSQAKMCITSFHYYDIAVGGNNRGLVVVRCPQVQNKDVYDSSGAIGTIINISPVDYSSLSREYYPIYSQNLNRIELYVSDSIGVALNGIVNTIMFWIQLRVIDYDNEEVDQRLMPSYTQNSLSYHVPLNV